MLVVVLCQFDPDSGESRATDTFYGTRILEVGRGTAEGCLAGAGESVCVGQGGRGRGTWFMLEHADSFQLIFKPVNIYILACW